MIKLSEIIKTDCYIDCGSNKKLREVVKVLPIKPVFLIIYRIDKVVRICTNPSEYVTLDTPQTKHPFTTFHKSI